MTKALEYAFLLTMDSGYAVASVVLWAAKFCQSKMRRQARQKSLKKLHRDDQKEVQPKTLRTDAVGGVYFELLESQ